MTTVDPSIIAKVAGGHASKASEEIAPAKDLHTASAPKAPAKAAHAPDPNNSARIQAPPAFPPIPGGVR